LLDKNASLTKRRLLEAGGCDWSDELFLDLLLNYLKPPFGANRPTLEMFKLGLQLIYSIFGGAKLHRKLMRQRHGSVALAHLMRSMPAEA
jgi:hypothetical protein